MNSQCGCRVVRKQKKISAPGGSKRNNVVEPRWCVKPIALPTAESQVGAWIVQQHPDHQFFGSFNCGVRYCRSCGAAIFSELFGKYMGLWPIVEKLTVQPGFRSQNVIATLDFTAVNLYRMPVPKDIREFNQDVRACIQRVMAKLGSRLNPVPFSLVR